MTKRIAYTITDNGIDGREKTNIVAAFWDEAQRDAAFDGNKNKAYYSKGEMIVDEAKQRALTVAKLDGLDRLLLTNVASPIESEIAAALLDLIDGKTADDILEMSDVSKVRCHQIAAMVPKLHLIFETPKS
jgi:hypothetical protein